MTQRRKLLQAMAATSAAALAGPWTLAQAQADFPSKPIKMLVPFGPGSTAVRAKTIFLNSASDATSNEYFSGRSPLVAAFANSSLMG